MYSVTCTLPDLGHAADVVAAEVHQHDVLGLLLLVGQQFVGQLAVLLLRRAARAACRRSGRSSTRLPVRRTMTSGDEPTSVWSPILRKNVYGDGFSRRSAR